MTDAIFEYSGLIFAIGGLLLAIPAVLAFHINYKEKTSWPLRSTIPTTAIFWVFVLAFYALMTHLPESFYWLAVIGMIAQSTGWTALIIQRLVYRRLQWFH